MFVRLFNNIQIERTDNKGVTTLLKVPCVYGQRSRILKSFQNQDRLGTYSLPMISYNRTGYTRAPDRLNNLHNEVKYEITSSRREYNLLTPVPVDISFDLTVYARYQADIDKIASNFMVFFNNDLFVSYEHPKFEGIKVDSQVVMQDGVSEEHPDELDGTQDDFITSTFQFTLKTFLFGGTAKFKKVKQQAISSYLSTILSTYVYEFKTDDEIRSYISAHPHNMLSTTLQKEVIADVTSYVETSSDTYDDGIPKVQRIKFGFYAVPKQYDIDQYILCVDNGGFGPEIHSETSGYLSSENYVMRYRTVTDPYGEQISVPYQLSTVNDYYGQTGYQCTLAPYVDRIYWQIDENSLSNFPMNVIARNCYDGNTLS